MMKRPFFVAAAGLVACASVGSAKSHEPADASFVAVSGGSACPTGTAEIYAGTSVLFRNPTNGNLTGDTRCWQATPSSTIDADVIVLGPCVVCRFMP